MYYVWKCRGTWRRNGDFAECYHYHWSWVQRHRTKADAIAACDEMSCRSVVTGRGLHGSRIHDNEKEESGRRSDLQHLPRSPERQNDEARQS